VGAVIAVTPYKSYALLMEFSTILLVWFVFIILGIHEPAFLFLPLIAATLIAVSYPIVPKITSVVACLVTLCFFIVANRTSVDQFTYAHSVLLFAAALMLLIHLLNVYTSPNNYPRKIDILLCSYSGNTAHYTNFFIKGAKEAGAEVTVHRYHHYKGFNAQLNGDSLVIAFPVIGWKPPWPLLYYLLFRLPKGKGKPAYIIYTSAGGPENAGVLVWLILSLKGYRVLGRSSAVYPLNIPTVRIGPRKMWKFIDSLYSRKITGTNQHTAGKEFISNMHTGLPFIFWPTPLVPLGILLDNKILNTIYRNHVMRKRCNQCGICINYCPSQRLQMINGYPKPKGTCVICFGCVNVCPNNAMHIWLFTEYGNQYIPKWKELIVKNRGKQT
jgi:ferredoxin